MHHPEHKQRLFSNLLTYPEVKLSVCSYHTHAHPHPFLLGNPALPARGRRTGRGASPVRGQPWQSPAGPRDAWQREPNTAPETPPGLLVALQELWPQGMGRCWALSSAVHPPCPAQGRTKAPAQRREMLPGPGVLYFLPEGCIPLPAPDVLQLSTSKLEAGVAPPWGSVAPALRAERGRQRREAQRLCPEVRLVFKRHVQVSRACKTSPSRLLRKTPSACKTVGSLERAESL